MASYEKNMRKMLDFYVHNVYAFQPWNKKQIWIPDLLCFLEAAVWRLRKKSKCLKCIFAQFFLYVKETHFRNLLHQHSAKKVIQGGPNKTDSQCGPNLTKFSDIMR